MKLKISDLPIGIRHISPLHYSKIVVKSQAWDVEKFVCTDITKSLLHKMVNTCMLDDGIGLAAPQIGVFKRLFIVRDMNDDRKWLDTFTTYFNPSFQALTSDKAVDMEGCLSVPGGAVNVARYTSIQATWWEMNEAEKLEKQTVLLADMPARVFQHELDHLNGISIVQRKVAV